MPKAEVFGNKFFEVAFGILLILCILFMTLKIQPILSLILEFVTTLLYPTLIAIVLYYILRPLRDFLVSQRVPKILAIVIIFLMIYVFISAIIIFIWPPISHQIAEFSSTPKEKLSAIENKTLDIMNIFNITSITREQLRETVSYYLHSLFQLISENLLFTIGSIAKIASYFIITPFILYYLLKEDKNMSPNIVSVAPTGYKKDFRSILRDIDSTLSIYISGQVLIALIVASLILVGYLIIGLNYAFLLAMVTFFFNLIPFGGPIIATVPAMFIGLADSPVMALKVLAVVLIVHLLDLNLISPRIVGQRLNIHPITVIFLLAASLSVFGILGMFLVTPLYSVLKVIFNDLYENRVEE